MAIRIFPLRFFPEKTSFDFMGKRWIGFSLSLIGVVATVILLLTKGLNFGIDFSGGILIEAQMEKAPDLAKMRTVLSSMQEGEVSLQNLGSPKDIMIRVGKQHDKGASQTQVVAEIKEALAKEFPGTIDYRKIDYVGPQVGGELIKNGTMALLLSFLAIMIYVWFRFEWQYGVGAVLALIHDAVITLGFFSLSGLEFNLTSVAAILTIVGYSINDSVVIYDRMRENLRKYKKISVSELLNVSLNDTLSRTILTVTTTLLATLSLILFGGEVIRSFSISMFFGIVIGTYSSIYISAPVLIYLNLRNERKY